MPERGPVAGTQVIASARAEPEAVGYVQTISSWTTALLMYQDLFTLIHGTPIYIATGCVTTLGNGS